MKILVVDDFATMWKIMRKLLKQLDFSNAEDADDGATAIEKLKADNYDFVITDLNMPQITGLELLQVKKEGLFEKGTYRKWGLKISRRLPHVNWGLAWGKNSVYIES
ncbi:MAG: response regulator [Deltaproteobacteria bacterium]|nr:response regulator [Deltaproteobacteria bacterium]